jgi:N-acetylglucosamine-6-phosphate deacetylase
LLLATPIAQQLNKSLEYREKPVAAASWPQETDAGSVSSDQLRRHSVIKLFGHLLAPQDRGLCLVTIEDGVVAEIEPAAEPVDGSLGGKTSRILPGLLDVQVNGAFGDDFVNPSADMDRICQGMLSFGVTGFVPTVVTSPAAAYRPVLANLRRSHRPGEARVLGAHIEGPFINPAYRGSHNERHIRLPSIDEAARWLEEGDVRCLTLAPELRGARDLISFLVARGVRVWMGHTDAGWDDGQLAVESGASMTTHLFNCMRPFNHRDPGLAGFVLATHLPAAFIGDGHPISFETIRMLARIKAPDELVLISDAIAGLGMPPGRYPLADREYISDGTCGRLLDGTLCGSLLPLNAAIRNLVEKAGVSPSDAVRFATANAARAIGLEDTLGLVERGRVADLVLVDEAWEVEATIVAGEVAYRAEVPA